MRMIRIPLIVSILLLIFSLGCSGGGSPVAPETNGIEKGSLDSSHYTWGMFTFICDPVNDTVDVVPMREVLTHLNALPFLEAPPDIYLTIESVEFAGNILEVDIGLIHPFGSLNAFTGFDTSGIIFTHGSVSGFDNPELVMAGEGDIRLLNPDGYSRWWNPAEFPHGDTIFNYVEGLLGTPSGTADYNTTVNGYKYYADDLGPDDPLTVLDMSKRGMFSAGVKNIRHYTIDLAGGLIFNYAVDTCWESPDGSPPWNVPDDFGPNANRPEAWTVSITELENTLYYDESTSDAGGNLKIWVDVYDHFDSNLNHVSVESLAGLPYTTSTTPFAGTEYYSTYEINLTGEELTENGDIDLFITIKCEKSGYSGLLPGKPVCAYFSHSISVADHSPDLPSLHLITPDGGEVWVVISHHDIEWESTGEIENVKLEYSKDDFDTDIHEIIATTENDGLFDWLIPNDPSTIVKVRISDVDDPGVNDISNDYFTITAGGQWGLVFPDAPIQLSDSSWGNCHNKGPGIIEDGEGKIVVSWGQIHEDGETPRPVDRISPDHGSNWDALDSYPVDNNAWEGHLEGTKMALDANGSAYALTKWYDVEDICFYGSYLIRCPFNSDDDWAWQMSCSVRGVELIFDQNGYPICFEDNDWFYNDEEIWLSKGSYQNSPMGQISGNPNHSWFHQAYCMVAQTPALISNGPSVVRDSTGKIWLAYQNGSSPDKIQMVYNTTDGAPPWNATSPLTIVEMSAPDIGSFDPTLWLDNDGGMHIGYIKSTTGTPETYSFVYMNSVTGDPDDFGTEDNAVTGMLDMEYPTIQCAEFTDGRAATAVFLAGDIVYAAFRDPATGIWATPVQVDVNSNSTSPSMWINQDDFYVHVVWEEEDAYGKRQIWYRRGEFVEQ